MRRTGKAVALFGLLFAAQAFAEVEFYQTVDKNKVGTEDTFRLTIVVGNAPDGATVQFPAPPDFEVLSRSQSTEMSYQLGGGGTGQIKRVQKYTLIMRANRAGTLKIPPAGLSTAGKDYKTDAIVMDVQKGRLAPDAPPPGRRGMQTPFGNFPFPSGGDDEDPFQGFFGPEPEIPRSDSDIFLRAAIDKESAYVGEQVTLTLTIYSRVDLASVDAVTMPKLEGFWSEDVDSPSQLAPEARVIGGVQYRAYLLRRRALFPIKSGTIEIDPAEAELTTGYLFRGTRLHRKGNALTLKVKPLPREAQGIVNVGRWRLSRELSQTTVAVNTPLQVRVMLEGRGSLKSATVPKLVAPGGFRLLDPSTTDKMNIVHGAFGGKRTQEYVVLPQRTGTFTLPPMTLRYFNPETARVEESTVDPVTITVTPGANGQTVGDVPPGGPGPELGPKNVLDPHGLKSLRYTASFVQPPRAVWSRPWFLPMAVTPFVLSLALGFVGFIRRRGANDPAAEKKKKARAARARLAAAEKLRISGKTEDFYSEVEKALTTFLEARLSTPAAGLTRAQLDEKMTAAAVAPEVRQKVKGALDTCDMGRFAPGMGDAAARVHAMDQAAQAMEVWDEK